MPKRRILPALSLLLSLSFLTACDPDQPVPGQPTTTPTTRSSATDITDSRRYIYPLIGYIEITEQADGSFRYHYNQGEEHLAVLKANLEEGSDGFGSPLKHEMHDGNMFSVYFSADEHRKMQYEYRYVMEEGFEYHRQLWPHHKSLSYNEDLSEVRLTIDRDMVDYVDPWQPWHTYGGGSTHYQTYNGLPVRFIIYYIDADTGEVFERIDNDATMLGPE